MKLSIKTSIDSDGLIDAKIGIRPEKLTLSSKATKYSITGEVIGVETLGAFTIVDIVSSSEIFKVRVPGQKSFKIGQAIFLNMKPGQVHLFDSSGISIAHPTEE